MSGALSAADPAIGAQEFSDMLEGVAPCAGTVAVAVSGGPDSMALATCLQRWGHRPIIALIVDHGLRAEAAAEAEQVKARLEKIGLTTEILRWQHPPVTARLHEKARAARYDLLLAACHRHGAGDIFLAHHRDDQAETVLMRIAKGSGVNGLAGMAVESRRNGIRLLRPFLSVAKTRLLATCAVAGIEFVSDPSNHSPAFARGRLRRVMPLLAEEGLTADRLIALSARAGEAQAAIDHYARQFLDAAAAMEDGGSLRLDRASLREVPRAIALQALSLGLRVINATPYPPEYAAVTALLDDILRPQQETARTLYGCLASIGERGVTLLREPEAATAAMPLQGGETIIWDGRWQVSASVQATGTYLVRALGNPPHDLLDHLAPRLRHDVPQGRVRATLPAIWQGDNLIAVAGFDDAALFSAQLLRGTAAFFPDDASDKMLYTYRT